MWQVFGVRHLNKYFEHIINIAYLFFYEFNNLLYYLCNSGAERIYTFHWP
jgi:hypothetical protein